MSESPESYTDRILKPYREAAIITEDDEALELIDYGAAAYLEDAADNAKPAPVSRWRVSVCLFLLGTIFGYVVANAQMFVRRARPIRQPMRVVRLLKPTT